MGCAGRPSPAWRWTSRRARLPARPCRSAIPSWKSRCRKWSCGPATRGSTPPSPTAARAAFRRPSARWARGRGAGAAGQRSPQISRPAALGNLAHRGAGAHGAGRAAGEAGRTGGDLRRAGCGGHGPGHVRAERPSGSDLRRTRGRRTGDGLPARRPAAPPSAGGLAAGSPSIEGEPDGSGGSDGPTRRRCCWRCWPIPTSAARKTSCGAMTTRCRAERPSSRWSGADSTARATPPSSSRSPHSQGDAPLPGRRPGQRHQPRLRRARPLPDGLGGHRRGDAQRRRRGGRPRPGGHSRQLLLGQPQSARPAGVLVRCAQGCYDAALAYETPFVSGKDSLNNEYTGADGQKHAIPGTLLISALGHGSRREPNGDDGPQARGQLPLCRRRHPAGTGRQPLRLFWGQRSGRSTAAPPSRCADRWRVSAPCTKPFALAWCGPATTDRRRAGRRPR